MYFTCRFTAGLIPPCTAFVFSNRSAFSSLEVYRCCDAIIVIATMLQASNKSQRQYTSYNWVTVPIAWPTAASFSAVSLKFLHIIKGKDELICTDLKQDQNTGFPNPSFFFIRGGEEHFTPMGGKERGSYFTLHQFHCFYEDFFLPSTCPTSIHSVTEFIKPVCNCQTPFRSTTVLFIIRNV